MRAGVRLAVAAVLSVAVAGCGDAGSDRARTVEQPAGAGSEVGAVPHDAGPARAFSPAQVKGALLSVSDLPTGWSAEPDDDSSSRDSSNDYRECPKYDAVAKKLNVRDAPVAGFISPTGTKVNETILSYPVAEATSLMTEFSAALSACKTLTTESGTGPSYVMHINALSFPKLADETFAFRMSASVYGTAVNLDMVLVRRGGVIIGTVQTARGVIDTAVTEDMTRRALGKVEQVLSA